MRGEIPLFYCFSSPLHSTNRSSTGQFRIVRREPRSTPQCTSWIICSGTGISEHVRKEMHVDLASVHLIYSRPCLSYSFEERSDLICYPPRIVLGKNLEFHLGENSRVYGINKILRTPAVWHSNGLYRFASFSEAYWVTNRFPLSL